MFTTHKILKGSERTRVTGCHATGACNLHMQIGLTLKLRRKTELPELTGRPAQQMTRDEFEAKYGASADDVTKVTAALAPYGVKVVSSHTLTRTVKVSGTVEQLQKAFGVTLLNYDTGKEKFRARTGSIHVPNEISDIVEGVFGLDNRRAVHRRRPPISGSSMALSLAGVPSAWWTPAELAKHYNFPAGDGAGHAVAVFEFGGGFFQSDLDQFCGLIGITSPTVIPISVDGTSTSTKDGAEGEVMLDVEILAGICPKSTIVAYFAEFTQQGWIAALDAVMQDATNNPGVVSISWGFAELDTDAIWDVQTITQVNKALKAAAMLGITVCVASGDDGSSDADLDGQAHVDFPSSSEYVLSVGGTTIPSKTAPSTDIVWFEGDGLRSSGHGSTGGGVSAVINRPTWQSTLNIPSVNTGAIVGRIIPDVAANADWNASPYLMVVDGVQQANGGTSAATPLVAGLLTLINASRDPNKRIGYLTPVLYQDAGAAGPASQTVGATSCTDVTAGNNNTAIAGGYAAGPGYDAASGWGTPDGVKLQKILAHILP